jgi:hypothetical protein
MAANPTRISECGAGSVPAWGKVFTVAELAAEWKLSESSIRKMFNDASGVFVLGSTGRRKRSYQTLRIPQNVAERVWRERGGGMTR